MRRASGVRTPILYLAPWVDLGGSDKGTIDWFKHLDKDRWAPSLITTQPSDNRWLHQVEPYAEEVWALPDLMQGAAFPNFIVSFIESRGVRVVHIMNSRLAFDLMPDMTCVKEPPAIVVQLHAEESDRSGYVRYVTTRYGNLVDRFSVTSRQLAAAMSDYDVPGSRIDVIHTGVDAAEEFNPELVEPFPELPGRGPHLLWPGRLVEQKDPMLTLEVVQALKRRREAFTLHVVGDGHMLEDVRRRARELGVDEQIAWHPPSRAMARWYRSCELLLMTSVFEGVPYVIYEALAMGLPVVAPALPGNLEVMDADSGALVRDRTDVEGYASALDALLSDDGRRREMGARSRERMLRDCDIAEMTRRHTDIYDELLARRPAAARKRPPELIGEHARGHEAGLPVRERLRLDRTPPPERSIAVIVPCYRHGHFLPACIDSIHGQTLPAAEIIVVDDGSDDRETRDALETIAGDPRVRVIRLEENQGPSVVRNRALREVSANYVLPLDADDLLVPEALERMVEQLEEAPPDVGFIYPNVQHFGNRNDYMESPSYNLYLLTLYNYCPATSLFDRRVFDAGARYPEDIVFGHEDWDLVLQLGERGVYGLPAHEKTFLYRRRGFSRVNAVEYGPESFADAIKERHPRLYEQRARLKRRWAPALSILLADGPTAAWAGALPRGLGDQTCEDFELLAPRPLPAPAGVEPAIVDAGGSDWLPAATAAARGRWVLVINPPAAPILERRTFVEQLMTAFWSGERVLAIALADAPGGPAFPFTQLHAHDRRGAVPHAVAWSRSTDDDDDDLEVEIGITDSPVVDLLLGLQGLGRVQFRSLPPLAPPAARPATRLTASALAGEPA